MTFRTNSRGHQENSTVVSQTQATHNYETVNSKHNPVSERSSQNSYHFTPGFFHARNNQAGSKRKLSQILRATLGTQPATEMGNRRQKIQGNKMFRSINKAPNKTFLMSSIENQGNDSMEGDQDDELTQRFGSQRQHTTFESQELHSDARSNYLIS